MSAPHRVDGIVFRAATPSDRAALHAMIEHDVAGTPYEEVPRYFLRLALEGRAAESRGIVALRDDALLGFILYGEVAGAIGTGRVHFVSVTASARLRAVGAALCDAAVADLLACKARVVVAEVPDDPALVGGLAMLTTCGFAEAARVPDYYRDGVALLVLQRQLVPRPEGGRPDRGPGCS